MKINEITLNPMMVVPGDPLRFRVGEAITTNGEAGHVVEKIAYNSSHNTFNKSLEIGVPCYAVYFRDIAERRLIAEGCVTSIEAVKVDAQNKPVVNTEAAVELPS
jgi:hypothetical protein